MSEWETAGAVAEASVVTGWVYRADFGVCDGLEDASADTVAMSMQKRTWGYCEAKVGEGGGRFEPKMGFAYNVHSYNGASWSWIWDSFLVSVCAVDLMGTSSVIHTMRVQNYNNNN